MSRLDRPIFVSYINIDGLSRQRSDELIQTFISQISPILGEDNIFIPIKDGDSKIELLWPGTNSMDLLPNFTSNNFKNLIEVIDNAFALIGGNWNKELFIRDEIFKIRTSLRNMKIDEIL